MFTNNLTNSPIIDISFTKDGITINREDKTSYTLDISKEIINNELFTAINNTANIAIDAISIMSIILMQFDKRIMMLEQMLNSEQLARVNGDNAILSIVANTSKPIS